MITAHPNVTPNTGSLAWERDGADWPNRAASRFLTAAGITWHVQQQGSGPALLLLHGTGASTHSWRDVLPLLSGAFQVLAPDLPGHGFSQALPGARQSLPGMADAIAELLQVLNFSPSVVVGHSAGAALLVRLCLDRRIDPAQIVSLNGAFLPYGGAGFQLLKPVTRLLATSAFTASVLAHQGRDIDTVRKLLERTGSQIDRRGLELYARLMGSPDHVAGTLAMMAGWDLGPLLRELPALRQPVALVIGTQDRAVKPIEAEQVQALIPHVRVVRLWGLGHLAHEESPQHVARVIRELLH